MIYTMYTYSNYISYIKYWEKCISNTEHKYKIKKYPILEHMLVLSYVILYDMSNDVPAQN